MLELLRKGGKSRWRRLIHRRYSNFAQCQRTEGQPVKNRRLTVWCIYGISLGWLRKHSASIIEGTYIARQVCGHRSIGELGDHANMNRTRPGNKSLTRKKKKNVDDDTRRCPLEPQPLWSLLQPPATLGIEISCCAILTLPTLTTITTET